MATPPFSVALLHGGPGTAGGMAPLARELAEHHGVLEPLQKAASIDGQVEELNVLLEQSCNKVGVCPKAIFSNMIPA